jgi:hypothetical protein
VTTLRRAWAPALTLVLVGVYVWLFRDGVVQELGLVAPYAALVLGALLVGAVAGALRPALLRRVADALVATPTWVFLLGAGALALVAALVTGWYGNGWSAATPDEATYLFQSQLLAHGHLTAPSPPHWQYYQFRFCLHQAGRWFGIYPPGWPLLLAVGMRVGAAHLVNPVLGVGLVLLVYPLARELSPTRPLVARLAVTLAALSVMRAGLAATTMSHMLGALCTTAAALGALRGLRTGAARWWLLVGLALGVQASTRLLNAFALGLPLLALAVAFAVGARREPRRVLAGLGALALAAGALGALHLVYNRAITGRFLEFPQRAYFAATEPKPRCSDPGFGPDRVCLHEHPPPAAAALPRYDFYPRHGVVLTRVRLDAYTREIAGGVLLFPFLLVGLAARRTRRAAWLCALFFASLWLAYGAFYYHGLAYGARYYFEASALVWIGIALGIAAAVRPAASWRPAAALRGGAALAVLALVIVLPFVRWPWYRDVWFHDYSDYGRGMAQAKRTLGPAIILHPVEMAPAIFNERPWDLASQRVIVVRDFGAAAGQELLAHYPGRRLYRWSSALQQPVPVSPDRGRVTLQGESFFPADRLVAGYASPARAPKGYCLKLFGYRAGAQAELRTHFRGGGFVARPRFWSGPDGGLLRVELDGRVLADGVDLYAAEPRLVSLPEAPVHLAGDQHVLRVIVRGKSPASAGYAACLEDVTLDRTD